MKFAMKKEMLLSVLDKMHQVGTKGVRNDFKKEGEVTIQVLKDKVVFHTSNGHLWAQKEVSAEEDNDLLGCESGVVTVDTEVLKKVVKAIGGPLSLDNRLSFELDDDNLHIKEINPIRTKKHIKMETIKEHHSVKEIKKPSKGFSYEFEAATFRDGVGTMAQYRSPITYKLRYQVICLHFLKDEVRFVCGDGARFGVRAYGIQNEKIKTDEGKMFIMPAKQAEIIANVSDGPKLSLTYESPTKCYLNNQNGLEMLLKGIPNEEYVAYENYAYRTNDAKHIADFAYDDFLEGVYIVDAVKDKELENSEESFHSCKFTVKDGKNELVVDENRYQCQYECPISFYKLAETGLFESEYAARFLMDVANASRPSDIVRFYCIEEKGTIIAEPTPIGDAKDDRGVPMSNRAENDPRMSFFFASALDEE